MKRTIGPIAIAIWLLMGGAPVHAVTGNFVPDTTHTYVGLIVFYDANGEFLHRCSGSLISPSVFLTAGHCTDPESGAVSARIYFQQDAGVHYDAELGIDPTTGYPETCIPDPNPYCYTSHLLFDFGSTASAGFPNTRDVGLVFLDEPVTFTTTFASLAEPGSLDTLATQRGLQNVTFTITGYGVSLVNPTRTISRRERLMATVELINLRSALTGGFNLQLTANPGGGKGGTCFGDSGGPILWDASDTIVAVNSFVLNNNCAGVAFAFRTDTTAVTDWILGLVSQYRPNELSLISIVPLT
jgi:hypothetical protein